MLPGELLQPLFDSQDSISREIMDNCIDRVSNIVGNRANPTRDVTVCFTLGILRCCATLTEILPDCEPGPYRAIVAPTNRAPQSRNITSPVVRITLPPVGYGLVGNITSPVGDGLRCSIDI